MFKSKIVNSRNIRKTVWYKVIQIIIIAVLLFFIASAYHLFGVDTLVRDFLKGHDARFINTISYSIIFLGIIFVMISRNRLKNPKILGEIELDENELRIIEKDEVTSRYEWNSLEGVVFEFYSVAGRNNPLGCINYLTIIKNSNKKTFEILIENSLTKADLGDTLKAVSSKVPVKVNYSIWLKRIIKDADFKFS